jgi:hypothetical protein
MKRTVVLPTVVVLMVVVMATSVSPAFAGGWVATKQLDPQTSLTTYVYCRAGDQATWIFAIQDYDYSAVDDNANRFVCLRGGDPDRPYDDKTAFGGGWVANEESEPVIGGTVIRYCRTGDTATFTYDKSQRYLNADRNGNFWVCVSNGSGPRPQIYDDRIF